MDSPSIRPAVASERPALTGDHLEWRSESFNGQTIESGRNGSGVSFEGETSARSVPFRTILWMRPAGERDLESRPAPAHFRDLNLDQVVAAATRGRDDYRLAPFFNAPLQDLDAIAYRHEVFRDLEGSQVREAVRRFAEAMRLSREHLAVVKDLYFPHQKWLWHLDAVEVYCEAVQTLVGGLGSLRLQSRGLNGFRAHLERYARSHTFEVLAEAIAALKSDLADIRYETLIRGDRVTVRRYAEEPDYSAAVERTFEKFKRGAVKDYRAKFPEDRRMNNVEGAVLELVARLYPEVFARLQTFVIENATFVEPTLGRFDREIQFYLAWVEHMARIRRDGLEFCYPALSETDPAEQSVGGFDLALAQKLIGEDKPVVTNDFELAGPERIIVVSGPNQGGKTTFARAFGQLHYLASLGLPVPGAEARLMLVDAVYSHFEREEDIANLRGKLEDDLVRIHAIVGRATARSAVVLNEIFNSTTLEDQVLLSTHVLEHILRIGPLCVCVTFIDELATLSESTVSMVSCVVADQPAERTFKVIRRPADGLAYAMSLADKHGVTHARLQERLTK